MLEAGNRGAGKVRREMGLGSPGARPGPGARRHLAEDTPTIVPHPLSYSTTASHHMCSGVVQLLGNIRQFSPSRSPSKHGLGSPTSYSRLY